MGILNIDSRVALPGGFIDFMAGPILAGFAKVFFTDFREVGKFGVVDTLAQELDII